MINCAQNTKANIMCLEWTVHKTESYSSCVVARLIQKFCIIEMWFTSKAYTKDGGGFGQDSGVGWDNKKYIGSMMGFGRWRITSLPPLTIILTRAG